MQLDHTLRYTLALGALAGLFSSCGLKRHPYENPITKDTQQPDKVLFDKAVHDMEHSRYEIARLTLQTLINTYDTSEYLAKAKLAIADSWYKEGGAHGLAQAEAEYKDFILFYPQMEESAEAQERVCDIHYRQMEKPDRDTNQALRAQEECKELILHYPNSKYAPVAQQRLREIQEVLAQNEFRVGEFYKQRGSYPAAANRLQALADHYPLFSDNDQALWDLADAYHKMGDRFENQEAAAYSRIVRDYPLSGWANNAKERLRAMNRPVPAADPEALALEKYNLENRGKKGFLAKAIEPFESRPDTRMAAKTGNPNMQTFQPTVPVSVPPPNGPAPAPGNNTVGAEVSAAVVNNTTALDQGKDARAVPPGQTGAATPAAGGATESAQATAQQPLPTNHPVKLKKQKKSKKAKPAPAAETSAPAPPAAQTQQ
ncbi:MAG TPA: outer membrane protein assembly factor BamD [Bryobacteraceae bacterium]|nr:outer membrane protein assembly factor BamD [Bryobacteraceae bacterium]